MPRNAYCTLAVDFEKAYNTITFEHAHVMFQLMGLPTGMIALMMQLLQALVSFCIQGIVIPDVTWIPRAGFTQGDPSSPALFVLLASVIIPILQTIHPGLCVRMYADDLVVYIACSDDEAEPFLEDILHALRTFGLHTWLRMNVSKSKVLLKGLSIPPFVLSLGLKVADKIKYLGVMIGHVTEKDIFASAISNSFLRAQTIRDMDMTQTEKVQLLKAWVYPLWILPARVCIPSKKIFRQMYTMVQTALGLDSWGFTLSEFGHSCSKGGFDVVLP